jgi:hypothetical protein
MSSSVLTLHCFHMAMRRARLLGPSAAAIVAIALGELS